jgi:hypothetical protein
MSRAGIAQSGDVIDGAVATAGGVGGETESAGKGGDCVYGGQRENGESTKHQDPSSREAPNFKFQIPKKSRIPKSKHGRFKRPWTV